ncbi:MAG: hypothetical protein Q7R43_06160 [Candidatus Daviesbacteria bacterium]|nr:hypothetical protein [Candidatus Daviesbacteria bacterium]
MQNPLSSLPIKNIKLPSQNHLFIIVLVLSVILGGVAGILLSGNQSAASKAPLITEKPKSASQDNRTFKDFAEGTIQPRPTPKDPGEYVEGTHFLVRAGAVPVALTSSVVDLLQYEGKKVKVLGETQKAIKEGWLMDVGKVEVQ